MKLAISILCLLLSSCGRYYLEVYQQRVDVSYLASAGAGTPDPHLDHPPLGQMLVVEWQVPMDLLNKRPLIQLDAIFWDHKERHYVWPVNERRGYETLFIIDEDFEQTGGIVTYRAKILTEEGEVCYEWRHQLWVNLITVESSSLRLPQLTGKSAPKKGMDQ